MGLNHIGRLGVLPSTSSALGTAPAAASSTAQGGVLDFTGSIPDVIGGLVTLNEVFNPRAALTYNNIAFSTVTGDGEGQRRRTSGGAGVTGEKDPRVQGARLKIAPFLEFRIIDRVVSTVNKPVLSSQALFEVVLWIDGTDILAGFTQLAEATGFQAKVGDQAGVVFGGTPMGKTSPRVFLLTFSGFVDRYGYGDQEFSGSVALRADGTMRTLTGRPVSRTAWSSELETPRVVPDKTNSKWIVGFSDDRGTEIQ